MLKMMTRTVLVIGITCLLLLVCTVASAEETSIPDSASGNLTPAVDAPVPVNPTPSWSLSTVDESGNAAVYIPLAFDDRGVPSIAYARMQGGSSYNYDLIYATRKGNAWVTEVVNNSGIILPPVSLAVDSSRHPHILYGYLLDGVNASYGLMYTSKESNGRWVTEAVPTGDPTSGYASLALDSRDDPSIAYVNARNNTLHYITRNSTGWQDQLVDNTSSLSRPVLRLDRFDNPHIAYTHNTGLYTGEKWYTTLSDGTWEKRMVAEGYTGWYVGLAVSGSGVPALSYVQSREGKPGLYYAPITASGQFVPYLVASGSFGDYTSLIYDRMQRPHIAYFVINNGLATELDHAYRDMTGWHTETVLPKENMWVLGSICDLHYDRYGSLHVTFASQDDESGIQQFVVKYASRDGTSPVPRPVPLPGPVTPITPRPTPTTTTPPTYSPTVTITPYNPPVTRPTPLPFTG